jgi:hypothetical protein
MPSTRSIHGRVTATDEDGKTIRPWVDLHTTDEKEARRKLAKLNADVNRAPVAELMRFEGYALSWHEARVARGVAQAPSEKGWLHNHILPVLGKPGARSRPRSPRAGSTGGAPGTSRGTVTRRRTRST